MQQNLNKKTKKQLLYIIYGLKGGKAVISGFLEEYKANIKSLQLRLDYANKKVSYLENLSSTKVTYWKLSKDTCNRSIGAMRRNQQRKSSK